MSIEKKDKEINTSEYKAKIIYTSNSIIICIKPLVSYLDVKVLFKPSGDLLWRKANKDHLYSFVREPIVGSVWFNTDGMTNIDEVNILIVKADPLLTIKV